MGFLLGLATLFRTLLCYMAVTKRQAEKWKNAIKRKGWLVRGCHSKKINTRHKNSNPFSLFEGVLVDVAATPLGLYHHQFTFVVP